MVKAMAIEGVTYGKRRKVTNSIIAQSEIKKMSTGRTLRVVVPVAKGRPWESSVRAETERCGVVRYAALDCGTAGKLTHERCTTKHSRTRDCEGGRCFCALAVKREGGCRMAKLQTKDAKGAVGRRMRQKKMQRECHVFHLIANIDCCLSVVRRNEPEQPLV